MTSSKNFCKFSKEQDEMLIDSVSRHPALYDASQKAYKDNILRDNIWREIAGIINRSPQDCKTRWRTLRDLYNRKLKLTKNKPTGTAASSKGSTWEYLDHMSFLRKVPKEKSSFTNVSGVESPVSEQLENDEETVVEAIEDTEEVESEKENSNPKRPLEDVDIPKKGANKKKNTDRVIEVIESRGKERGKLFRELMSAPPASEPNPIMTFFQSMAQTVMTLPPNLAVEAKAKVCQIITDLEYRSILQHQVPNQSYYQPTTSVYQEPSYSYQRSTTVRDESHSSLDAISDGTSLHSPPSTETANFLISNDIFKIKYILHD